MHFVPDYQLKILSENEFSEQIEHIDRELDKYRISGFFNSFDGQQIFYEYFLAENSRASVVLVHGLSEFTKKYYEVTYYFLRMGYNVFLYDQRCHGFSCRLTDRIDLIHVDRFSDYADDLDTYINKIVLSASSAPVYLYSHSMGGAVAVLYLAKHPDKVAKAILSAPMFAPTTGVAFPVARVAMSVNAALQQKTSKFRFSAEFNPEGNFERAMDESRSRFDRNMGMRRNDPHYQSTPMTVGWVHNSLALRAIILSPRVVGRIRTPLLLLSAGQDTVVNTEPHYRFAEKCSSCRLAVLKNAKHAMLTGTPEVIAEHLKLVFDFFGTGEVSA